jgi:threonyl-tRNA synthetase
MLHYNYIAVIGNKEVESNIVNLRNPKVQYNFDEFVKFLQSQNKN